MLTSRKSNDTQRSRIKERRLAELLSSIGALRSAAGAVVGVLALLLVMTATPAQAAPPQLHHIPHAQMMWLTPAMLKELPNDALLVDLAYLLSDARLVNITQLSHASNVFNEPLTPSLLASAGAHHRPLLGTHWQDQTARSSHRLARFQAFRDAPDYRQFQRNINHTRMVLTALYQMGDSVVSAGILELTDAPQDLDDVRAEIAPAWIDGRPTARLKISF